MTRIQLSRRKGWKLPAGAVVVARPTKWGNPFKINEPMTRGQAIAAFRTNLVFSAGEPWERMRRELGELRGKVLACWCRPGDLCHADVLIEFANAPPCEPPP